MVLHRIAQMNRRQKISIGLAFLITYAGMSLQAGRLGANSHSNDSLTKATKAVTINPQSVVDEVIWVVGDEPILKSDVEAMRLQSELEGVKWNGDPDCIIPEQLAVQKLFLHQAAIDSIDISESEIASEIEQQINYWIQQIGSKEKLEEYRRQSITQIRQQMHDDFKNRLLIQEMKKKLVKDIAVTPGDVRRYFESLPADSVPTVPTTVEVEIITMLPRVSQEEIAKVKNDLRDYTDRVTKGETSFATLARLYSEDPGSARQGGEMDYTGRGMFDPAFAAVAFNLTDPKKISKIVETEFGYHIIQLIDKRGDKVKVRHILRKPVVSAEVVEATRVKMDSLLTDIRDGKFTFEDAAFHVSDDKDTRNNKGLMVNNVNNERTSRFQMRDLPTEVARQVETLKPGEISNVFEMVNDRGKKVCAIVKLKNRVDAHKAVITEDYQVLKNVVLAKEREKFLHNWVVNKIKNTYIRMENQYKNCNFEYQGWIK